MFDSNRKEHEEENIADLVLAGKPLQDFVFHDCVFENSDFSTSDLSGSRFNNCAFSSCNLSNCVVIDTAFRGVTFTGCKLLGIDYSPCDNILIEIAFAGCDMPYAHFAGLDLSRTKFIDSTLNECVFEGCNLQKVDFSGSTLAGATFTQCNLRDADFRRARDYFFDVRENNVKGASFALPEAARLLKAFNIKLDGMDP